MKPLRVLLLMHVDLVPPDSIDGVSEEQMQPWKTEYDVWAGLCNAGHDVKKLGVYDDLGVIRDAIEDFKPHITFNLLEEFHGVAVYDHSVVSYLELMKKPYTGCNPRGLMLAHDKALSKSILSYHRVPVPDFAVFPVGRKVRKPAKLAYPLLVKSLTEEGSVGISQASIVYDDDKLVERVRFIHNSIGTDALVEQYIEGREFYVGIIGNQRLMTLPVWELGFDNLPDDSAAIATSRVKWDYKYQQRVGVHTGEAKDITDALRQKILNVSKRAYKLLNLTGYARMDLRVDADEKVYLIEANPNPQLAYGEDFAEAAEAAGINYEQLMARIVSLGLSYRPAWRTD
ncbi:MAG: ATP-grasp domain-containing protein [Phycisphaera sp.]|nr:ATP-grasp domain-containing protein [Phycisphaera sp.]